MIKQILYFYFCTSVLNLTLVNSEILFSEFVGIYLETLSESTYDYPNGNQPGTTYTVTAYNTHDENVQLLDSSGNIIYRYYRWGN